MNIKLPMPKRDILGRLARKLSRQTAGADWVFSRQICFTERIWLVCATLWCHNAPRGCDIELRNRTRALRKFCNYRQTAHFKCQPWEPVLLTYLYQPLCPSAYHKANPGLSIPSSLTVAFPFKVLVGIPLYLVGKRTHGVV